MDAKTLNEYFLQQLQEQHEGGEAASISRLLTEFLMNEPEPARAPAARICLDRIRSGEPVQYVVGHTWFYDLKIHVDQNVLIPRPETEELVNWLVTDYHNLQDKSELSFLDVGTGSGCIALSIKKEIPEAFVTALDISPAALEVAMSNAVENGLFVEFRIYDFLNEFPDNEYDAIISNPPYISKEESLTLPPQVQYYEPSIALSPSSDDHLIFYRRLAELGHTLLKEDGRLYMELNEFKAQQIRALFMDEGYDTEMRHDMQGKWRMLKAWFPR